MVSCGLNHNSIIPAIREGERFIKFLNNELDLGISEDLILTISKSKKSNLGHYASIKTAVHFVADKKDIPNINLNSLYLVEGNPYQTLTHEVAHHLNDLRGFVDCSSNQYHNKHFKAKAEELKLKTTYNKKRGYAFTEETEEFKQMLKRFKPLNSVWEVFQVDKTQDKKKPQLNALWICSCGVKIRSARDLNVYCNDCETDFARVER